MRGVNEWERKSARAYRLITAGYRLRCLGVLVFGQREREREKARERESERD